MLITQVLGFLTVICVAIRPRTAIDVLRLYVAFFAVGVGAAGLVG